MRLLCDVMCGKLATYLRMCGYDTAYALDRGVEDDDVVLEWAEAERRRLVTRDISLAGRRAGSFLLSERDVGDQLAELRAQGLDLSLPDEPTRCGACNGELEPHDGDRPEHAPDDAPLWRCRDCAQLFWRGSHWDDVKKRLGG